MIKNEILFKKMNIIKMKTKINFDEINKQLDKLYK